VEKFFGHPLKKSTIIPRLGRILPTPVLGKLPVATEWSTGFDKTLSPPLRLSPHSVNK